MKSIIIGALLLFAASPFSTAQDSEPKETRFRVNGICGMCKTRIEKSVRIEGVSKAQWNKTSRFLTVVYKPALVTVDSLERRLALAGHDTDHYKAADSTYSALPECCHYRTGSTH